MTSSLIVILKKTWRHFLEVFNTYPRELELYIHNTHIIRYIYMCQFVYVHKHVTYMHMTEAAHAPWNMLLALQWNEECAHSTQCSSVSSINFRCREESLLSEPNGGNDPIRDSPTSSFINNATHKQSMHTHWFEFEYTSVIGYSVICIAVFHKKLLMNTSFGTVSDHFRNSENTQREKNNKWNVVSSWLKWSISAMKKKSISLMGSGSQTVVQEGQHQQMQGLLNDVRNTFRGPIPDSWRRCGGGA